MHYEKELSFLKEVYARKHISVRITEADSLCDLLAEYQEQGMRDERFVKGGEVYSLVSSLRPGVLYKFTDSLYRRFICLLLPTSGAHRGMVIGPCLTSPMSDQRIMTIGEQLGISPQKQRYLREYYHALPIMLPDGTASVMLKALCELIWQTPSYSVKEVSAEGFSSPHRPIAESVETGGISETTVNIKAMELRYSFENELMRAVMLGQSGMEEQFLTAFSSDALEKRVANPLRNAKNYSIIMNTLLRKAAEKGGVHPVYLDRASSNIAGRIEDMTSAEDTAELMRDIFSTYCLLVRRHSVRQYSTVVKRAMLTVDADVSAELSSGIIAREQGISSGYLSTVFRKETGKTLSEFIRERRMERAEYLLATTDLQIQTVALYCGIMDVQYFTKLFKRQTGLTPTEYRHSRKGVSNFNSGADISFIQSP